MQTIPVANTEPQRSNPVTRKGEKILKEVSLRKVEEQGLRGKHHNIFVSVLCGQMEIRLEFSVIKFTSDEDYFITLLYFNAVYNF